MKKIFNWTIASFFRTLGRILSYIFISGILFYLAYRFNLLNFIKLNASEFTYSYNVKQNMIDLMPDSWFGTEGWLSRIDDAISSLDNSSTIQPDIWLSKDTIYVVYGNISLNGRFIDLKLNYDDSKFISSVSMTAEIYSIKTKDEVNKFISLVDAPNLLVNDLTKYSSLDFSCNSSKTLISADINGPICDTFIVPFKRNKTNKYYFQNTSSFNNINFYGLTANLSEQNKKSEEFSSIFLYSLYGYDKPDLDSSNYIFNNAFILDSSNINNANSSFSFKVDSNLSPDIENIEYFGLVNDGGLMHYEKINNISNFNYSTKFSSKVFTFSFNTNSFTYDDLRSYEKVYIKINYSLPVKYVNKTFKYKLGSEYTSQVILNDVCSDCLFVSLDSSGNNTFTFSNIDSSKNTQLFYSNIQDNDILYNKPSFVNLSESGLINSNINIRKYNSFYGTLNKIVFSNYKIANNTGLIMNLYMNDLSDIYNITGSFQIIYFITPNLYWGNSIYAVDRNSVDFSYVDSDGNMNSGTLNGDFSNPYSDYDVSSGFNIIKGIMSDDFYGLSGIILKPLEYIKDLSKKICSPINFTIPYTNKNVSLPCMSSIYSEYVKGLFDIWQIVLYGVVSYRVGLGLFKTIKDVIDIKDNDEIEVLDL